MGCGSSKDKDKDKKDASDSEEEEEDEDELEEEAEELREELRDLEDEAKEDRNGNGVPDYEETQFAYGKSGGERGANGQDGDPEKPLPKSFQPAYQKSHKKPPEPRVVGGKKGKPPPGRWNPHTKDYAKDIYQTWKSDFIGKPEFTYY